MEVSYGNSDGVIMKKNVYELARVFYDLLTLLMHGFKVNS